MPLVPFALVIFQIGSQIYAQVGLDFKIPFYTSHVASLLVEMESCELFAWAGLEP
jgi:hypothetical protein